MNWSIAGGVAVALAAVGAAVVAAGDKGPLPDIKHALLGEAKIEQHCLMNGLGKGECSFTNTGTAAGSVCGQIEIHGTDGRAGAERSGTICSGEVAKNTTTRVEFTIAGVPKLCAPGEAKSWTDVCAHSFERTRQD
jgi:hypothetical protein